MGLSHTDNPVREYDLNRTPSWAKVLKCIRMLSAKVEGDEPVCLEALQSKCIAGIGKLD